MCKQRNAELQAANSASHTSRENLTASIYGANEINVTPSELPEKPSYIYRRLWQQNKSIVRMILAQLCNTVMAAIARLMETLGGDIPPMNPFQMVFTRQSITVGRSLLYMWWCKIADAPFGAREVRLWLVARGVSGFFGLPGLYSSLERLPVSDAIVLTFLAPMLASYLSSYIVGTPFTRRQQAAGLVCIVDVVLITRPASLFTVTTAQSSQTHGSADVTLTTPIIL